MCRAVTPWVIRPDLDKVGLVGQAIANRRVNFEREITT